MVLQQESATYQFWVTASTKVGEGESTRVVTIAPSNKGKWQATRDMYILNRELDVGLIIVHKSLLIGTV
jgi:hypothetical protein